MDFRTERNKLVDLIKSSKLLTDKLDKRMIEIEKESALEFEKTKLPYQIKSMKEIKNNV